MLLVVWWCDYKCFDTIAWVEVKVEVARKIVGQCVIHGKHAYVLVPHVRVLDLLEAKTQYLLIDIFDQIYVNINNATNIIRIHTQETFGDHFNRKILLNLFIIDLVLFLQQHVVVVPVYETWSRS